MSRKSEEPQQAMNRVGFHCAYKSALRCKNGDALYLCLLKVI